MHCNRGTRDGNRTHHAAQARATGAVVDFLNVLVVEDDATLARALVKIGSEIGKVHLARTVAEARVLLAKGFDWAAMVVDYRLPDGDGLELLALARRSYPETPAALFTGFMEDDTIERAYNLGARCVQKDAYGLEQIRYFLRGVLELLLGEPDPLLTAARAWCDRYDFTDAEADVFIQLAQGLTHREIARNRRTTLRAVRGHEQGICKKTGDQLIGEATDRFFRDSLRERWRRRPRT
jgi:DNA-binding NarL/FixJ family response regulator